MSSPVHSASSIVASPSDAEIPTADASVTDVTTRPEPSSTSDRTASEDAAHKASKRPHSEPHPASTTHKLVMLSSVMAPFLGFMWAVYEAWSRGRFGWFDFNILAVTGVLTGIGISVGFHRMLTHRAFQAHWLVRNTFTALGALSLQKSPLDWCASHRRHHQLSDQPGDPHSPHTHEDDSILGLFKGLWYAHTGWLFTGHMMVTDHHRYVPELRKEKFVRNCHKQWETVWIPLTFLIPAAIGAICLQSLDGAWRGLLWGGLARVFLVHHFTWSVNSICHVWGSREFEARDESRNNALVALVSTGEGWHNNHHAFPTSAKLGLRWWQLDYGWYLIWTLEKLGLVWDVQKPSEAHMAKKRIQRDDLPPLTVG